MLIKVTNYCSMGCSHCMEDSTVAGKHMTEETFHKALSFTQEMEHIAWQSGAPPMILLSGGEATEHPDIVKFIAEVIKRDLKPVLITNGTFLADKELREAILRPEWTTLSLQVTNDPRFYPKRIQKVEDERITYIDALNHTMSLGRFVGKKSDLPTKQWPASFNLRSMTIHFKDIRLALQMMRVRAAVGMSGHCSPNITNEGWVMAGETRNCFKIGTVESKAEELTKALTEMTCNKCGLEDNLSPAQKRAINASVLYSHRE